MRALNLKAYEEYTSKHYSKSISVRYIEGDSPIESEIRNTIQELRVLARNSGKVTETEIFIQSKKEKYKELMNKNNKEEGSSLSSNIYNIPIVQLYIEILDRYFDFLLPINGQNIKEKEIKKIEDIVGKFDSKETVDILVSQINIMGQQMEGFDDTKKAMEERVLNISNETNNSFPQVLGLYNLYCRVKDRYNSEVIGNKLKIKALAKTSDLSIKNNN